MSDRGDEEAEGKGHEKGHGLHLRHAEEEAAAVRRARPPSTSRTSVYLRVRKAVLVLGVCPRTAGRRWRRNFDCGCGIRMTPVRCVDES